MKRSYLGLIAFVIIFTVAGISIWDNFVNTGETNVKTTEIENTPSNISESTSLEDTSVGTDGTFVNTKYGFEMNLSGDFLFNKEGIGYRSAEDIQYILGDSLIGIPDLVSIRVIKDQTPQELASALAMDSGPYLSQTTDIEINGLPVVYVEFGYASGDVLRMYNFAKNNNTISVSIYTSKNSTVYKSIIKTFKLI